MHVAVAVLGSVVMGMGVLVLDVLVFVSGVRVGVSDFAMLVLVRMRSFMRVFVVRHFLISFVIRSGGRLPAVRRQCGGAVEPPDRRARR